MQPYSNSLTRVSNSLTFFYLSSRKNIYQNISEGGDHRHDGAIGTEVITHALIELICAVRRFFSLIYGVE